jgi:hypothetical protein
MTWQHFDGSPCDWFVKIAEVTMTKPIRGRNLRDREAHYPVCRDGRLVREVL